MRGRLLETRARRHARVRLRRQGTRAPSWITEMPRRRRADDPRGERAEASGGCANGLGLHGVRLVTSDDHRGLVWAVREQFLGNAWQRSSSTQSPV
ncbi:MAG: transposase [Candidatus Limnocylindrales bacterium]